jgi:hypothetical protein
MNVRLIIVSLAGIMLILSSFVVAANKEDGAKAENKVMAEKANYGGNNTIAAR